VEDKDKEDDEAIPTKRGLLKEGEDG